MFWVMHDIVLKLHPGQKSGHVVARASVAPVRLHRPICRKGINTLRIFAASEGDGGGVLLQHWHLGDLGAPQGGPKNKYLEETARPQTQNQLW